MTIKQAKKTLYLSLKKSPFEVMVTGEKTNEYREPSQWIKSRLYDKNGNPKHYDEIRYTNGYGPDKPYFVTDFYGGHTNIITQSIEYSNGFRVIIASGDYIIVHTKILEKGNLK